ncbi:MAG: hypothetical protein WD424_05740 [Paenibacillaceae bacterium]
MQPYTFKYDERLDIELPQLHMEWSEYSMDEREAIVTQWEHIRGTIPERIKQFEQMINIKQDQLNREFHFPTSCTINWEIAELASRINDLHLWFRMNQEIDEGKSHR